MKTLRHINTGLVLIGLAAAGSGCGGGGSSGEGTSGGETAVTETGTEVTSASGEAVSVEAHNRWTGANELFNQYETQGWNESRCEEVIEAYERTISAQRSLAEAHYMAGLTASRCGDTSEAREHYERALSVTATMCKPRVALGLMSLEAGNVAEARTAFTRAIEENPATCSSGYTNLAILQRREAAGQAGEARTATETEALNNLRRALAIDSDDMAAYNQMALLYYTRGLRNNPAAHDLAEIVCRQAQLLSDTYAPIYNTWGLIKVARGDVNGALRFFARAITLDSALYEAQMNFGQITFSFRGYADARGAFSRALELRPNSYDAALGLGAALRGLNEVEQSEAQYNRAIQLDGDRPRPTTTWASSITSTAAARSPSWSAPSSTTSSSSPRPGARRATPRPSRRCRLAAPKKRLRAAGPAAHAVVAAPPPALRAASSRSSRSSPPSARARPCSARSRRSRRSVVGKRARPLPSEPQLDLGSRAPERCFGAFAVLGRGVTQKVMPDGTCGSTRCQTSRIPLQMVGPFTLGR
jgi:tetratricopeptide (TPR) repeat protein